MAFRVIDSAAKVGDLKLDGAMRRSFLMICNLHEPTDKVIKAMHDWLHEIPDEPPNYACFVGKFSEAAHDIYDEINVLTKRFALTTWHVDESFDEIAFFFLETINCIDTVNTDQVMVCELDSPYQNALLKAMVAQLDVKVDMQ